MGVKTGLQSYIKRDCGNEGGAHAGRINNTTN